MTQSGSWPWPPTPEKASDLDLALYLANGRLEVLLW